MQQLRDQLRAVRRYLRPLPEGWQLIAGADTGTYMSVGFVAVAPGDEPEAIVLAEFPNYRYVAHEIELLGCSTPEWSRIVYSAFRHLQPRTERCRAWADPNTQFRAELAHYKIDLRPNFRGLELRVEITREYMRAVLPSGEPRLKFAPWLQILPYEIEHAKWPDGTTSAGRFVRIKEHDHTLDTIEHALSRRPRSKRILRAGKKSFLERYVDEHRMHPISTGDPHLGKL